MSKQDLQILKDVSWNMDVNPGQQSPSVAFEHAMSNGLTGQSASEAEQEADQFIAGNEREAQQLQAEWIASGHKGFSPLALNAFGNALHTITDKTSPSHAGYQPWYGMGLKHWGWARFLRHEAQESYWFGSNRNAVNQTVQQAQQAFQQTFGASWDEFDLPQLQQPQPQQACVSAYDSATGSNTMACEGNRNMVPWR